MADEIGVSASQPTPIEVVGAIFRDLSTRDADVFAQYLADDAVFEISRPGVGRARVPTSVNVVRVRDGKVVLFRDYMDTARFTRRTE